MTVTIDLYDDGRFVILKEFPEYSLFREWLSDVRSTDLRARVLSANGSWRVR